MKLTEEEIYVIQQLKEHRTFDPEDGSYNATLRGLEQKGWINIRWSEFDDAPAYVGMSDEFSEKYRQYFE